MSFPPAGTRGRRASQWGSWEPEVLQFTSWAWRQAVCATSSSDVAPTESECREQEPSGLVAAFLLMMNVLGFESEPHSPLSFISTNQCQCVWSTLRPVTLLSLWAQRTEGKTLCKVTRLGF